METIKAIQERRSIRIFEDRPIPGEMVRQLIEAATNAPSACNIQGWKFIIVDRQEIKDGIFDNGGSVMIKKAPLGILVLYDNRSKNFEYKDFIQSASAATQNLQLAAFDMGLGTCCIDHLPSMRTLRKMFNIPSSFSPITYVLVGYPKIRPAEVKRKYQLEEVMNYNEFNPSWPVERVNMAGVMAKRLLIRLYHHTPLFVKKNFLNDFIDRHFVKKFKN